MFILSIVMTKRLLDLKNHNGSWALVAIHLKALIPVGIAMIVVADHGTLHQTSDDRCLVISNNKHTNYKHQRLRSRRKIQYINFQLVM